MSKPEMIIKKVDEADITSLVLIARQTFDHTYRHLNDPAHFETYMQTAMSDEQIRKEVRHPDSLFYICLLYTSPSPRDLSTSRMPSSA